MVAVIKTGHSVLRILNYNENKIKEGVAECIGEGNYPVDADKLTFAIKHNRLQKQLELNRNVTRNSVHISLNFDPSESGMGREKLLRIAEDYMFRIGFGEQPYLVYQHYDAGHPHIHIVSIKVRPDGSRIDMQNIGKNQSEKARREIEQKFDLVVADERARLQADRIRPVDAKRALYGRTETKRAITNILDAVLDKYKYTSLPELNAVLKQYNIMADRCSEQSRIFKSGGLVYRILDTHGKPVGVPVKASDFYSKPTLKLLEEKYTLNESRRKPHKARIRNEIDRLLVDRKISLDAFTGHLERKGIHVAFRQNEQGLIYGITYVDHQTKCVFNGSALGKPYSAKAIQERCLPQDLLQQNLLPHSAANQEIGLQFRAIVGTETKDDAKTSQPPSPSQEKGSLMDTLIQPEPTADYVPGQLKKKGRKKKKIRNISNNP